jgi:hypothetical protein
MRPKGASRDVCGFNHLDEKRARPYSPAMINAATILIARRRRTFAVWADVRV